MHVYQITSFAFFFSFLPFFFARKLKFRKVNSVFLNQVLQAFSERNNIFVYLFLLSFRNLMQVEELMAEFESLD